MQIQTILIGISSAYILSSSLLFMFPNIIHRKKSIKNPKLLQSLSCIQKPLHIAHRGGSRFGTQNTIQTFRRVVPFTDCLQMDVCETKDGVLVVHHDRSLLRTCGIDQLISQVNFDDLPKYSDEIQLDFTQNNMKMTTNNQKIPKLQNIFMMFPHTLIDIQLKTPTPTAVKQFVRLIYQYQRQDCTIVGIRDRNNHKFIDTHLNNVQIDINRQGLMTFMNDRSVIRLYLLYMTGLLPFFKIKQSSLQIPVYSSQLQKWAIQKTTKSNRSLLITKIGCRVLKFMNKISGPLVWHLRQRGIITFGWVCNQEDGFRRAMDMGVAGIMTDQVGELREFLNKNKRDD